MKKLLKILSASSFDGITPKENNVSLYIYEKNHCIKNHLSAFVYIMY